MFDIDFLDIDRMVDVHSCEYKESGGNTMKALNTDIRFGVYGFLCFEMSRCL